MITSVTVAEKGDIPVCANGGGREPCGSTLSGCGTTRPTGTVAPERPASDQHHRHPR